jgi:hypothetical protein
MLTDWMKIVIGRVAGLLAAAQPSSDAGLTLAGLRVLLSSVPAPDDLFVQDLEQIRAEQPSIVAP